MHLVKLFFLTRMAAQRGRKTRMAKRPSGVPGPSPSSSRRPNLAYSSRRQCTPLSHLTRATYAPLYARPTTPSPFPLTHLHQSSALFVKAQACTSPLSCLLLQLLQPAARACRLPQHPSQPHAACCVPVSKKNKDDLMRSH